MSEPHNYSKRKRLKSSVVIAEMLKSEGFTDHTANAVTSYAAYRLGLSVRQLRQFRNLKKEMGEIMRDMPESKRLVIGRFIGIHKKIAFDTGLRIGLQAFAQQHGQEVEGLDYEQHEEQSESAGTG